MLSMAFNVNIKFKCLHYAPCSFNISFVAECVGAFSVEVKELASRILNLISEGLGMKYGYFDNDLTGAMLMSVNQYPPCPEPSLTLGITKHSDPNLITILLQDDVSGLQVFKDGDWFAVEALPHAFVINVGYQLQVPLLQNSTI